METANSIDEVKPLHEVSDRNIVEIAHLDVNKNVHRWVYGGDRTEPHNVVVWVNGIKYKLVKAGE